MTNKKNRFVEWFMEWMMLPIGVIVAFAIGIAGFLYGIPWIMGFTYDEECYEEIAKEYCLQKEEEYDDVALGGIQFYCFNGEERDTRTYEFTDEEKDRCN